MTPLCPKCGQRLRSGWIRCPRCRERAPEPVQTQPPEPTAPSSARWLWVGASLVTVAGILSIISVVGTRTGAENASAEPEVPPVRAPIVREPQTIDPTVLARNKSAESKIAGYAAYSAGNLDAALASFQQAVEQNPEDPEARNNLAQVLVRLNRPGDALMHLDEAIQLDGTKWAYRFNRARAYAQLNRLSDAATEYRVASNMFPDDYATQYNLGLVLLKSKQYLDAVQALERAVALAPSEPSFLISLGTAYVAIERPDRAKATFEQFLEMAPDDPEAPRVKALIQALNESQPS